MECTGLLQSLTYEEKRKSVELVIKLCDFSLLAMCKGMWPVWEAAEKQGDKIVKYGYRLLCSSFLDDEPVKPELAPVIFKNYIDASNLQGAELFKAVLTYDWIFWQLNGSWKIGELVSVLSARFGLDMAENVVSAYEKWYSDNFSFDEFASVFSEKTKLLEGVVYSDRDIKKIYGDKDKNGSITAAFAGASARAQINAMDKITSDEKLKMQLRRQLMERRYYFTEEEMALNQKKLLEYFKAVSK